MKTSKPDFEDSTSGTDADSKGLKEGSKKEEAADRKEEGKPGKKMPFPMKGLNVTKRSPKVNRSQVL